jgi:hypothetical protein
LEGVEVSWSGECEGADGRSLLDVLKERGHSVGSGLKYNAGVD